MKLPLREAEQEPLLRELGGWDGHVSSALLGVEAIRACARYGEEYELLARAWMSGISLVPLDDIVLDASISLGPVGLRSLDALHLATALTIRDEVGAFVVYDRRLADAAEAIGLPVVQPGLDVRSMPAS